MGKGIKTLFLVCTGVIIIGVLLFSSKYFSTILNPTNQVFDAKNDKIANVMNRNSFESSARRFLKAGEFDKAIALYRQAIKPELINEDYEKSTAMGMMCEIYKRQKKYDKALEMNRWFLENSATGKPTKFALEEKKEIETLMKYASSADPSVIYQYIQRVKEFYKKELPPIGYDVVISSGAISDILRLYDTIGDYDAGIKFIDEILTFFKGQKKNREEDFAIYDKVKTVTQATECMETGPSQNPNWHACKLIREFLRVREAFGAEKKAGGPTCRSKILSEGEYCIGDATKALIQSSEFPW
ncbi:MAG: tetratricopeptide repeat protein [Candidatus Omnitrophota bacterium]